MGYKKIFHKSKESRIQKCVECGRKFLRESGDESNTCPECVEQLLQPCRPLTEVA
jgi:DNA-directed RNA polymerase subunit RPC12/RpoP